MSLLKEVVIWNGGQEQCQQVISFVSGIIHNSNLSDNDVIIGGIRLSCRLCGVAGV